MSILSNAIAFIVAVGVLVTFHEFGHYWVARRLGVKVLRFSVGFGRPLWRRVAGRDATEYVVAAIPLGGYVKMLDEREGPVAPEERERAFNRRPVGERMAIVGAGPLANFLFAVLAYWVMYLVGVNGVKPVVGEVVPGSVAAAAGMQEGDRIVAVGGKATPTWQSASLAILDDALDASVVPVEVTDASGLSRQLSIDMEGEAILKEDGQLLEKLGIEPWRPRLAAVIGGVVDDGAAEKAGLREGDRIVRVDGETLDGWQAWVDIIRSSPDRMLSVDLLRDGRTVSAQIRPAVEWEDGERIGRIGAYPKVDASQWDSMRITVRYGVVEALVQAMDKTWEVAVLTLRVLWKLIIGEAALSNISGPVTIAEFAGMSAAVGLSAFLGALAIFSISIGILNLLPVPVLDGGHLMFYLVELVKGSPVSELTEAMGQRVGLAMLAGLMALALYNDFVRLLG